jgi:hypothetical protein
MDTGSSSRPATPAEVADSFGGCADAGCSGERATHRARALEQRDALREAARARAEAAMATPTPDVNPAAKQATQSAVALPTPPTVPGSGVRAEEMPRETGGVGKGH